MKKITQSFITDMRQYLAGGSCGHLIRERWINGRLLDDGSKAMKLGTYFEYIFTEMMLGKGKGSLPKEGKIPQPDLRADFKKLVASIQSKQNNPKTHNPDQKIPEPTEADMLAPYQLAWINARRLKDYFDLMGIKIIQAGKRLTKGKFDGTIDLICEATKQIKWTNGEIWEVGYRFVLDLKYAGTLEDRWSPYGWAGLTQEGENEQKRIHGTQAIQYHYITGLPFYFMVVSSSNDIDVKFFKVEITKRQIERHIAEANDLNEKLIFYNEVGWEPRPDISKCAECALRNECKDIATYPQMEIVTL